MSNISLKGEVTIRNGDTVICENVSNHFVDAGMKGFLSTIISSNTSRNLAANAWQMYVGRDTETPTDRTMTKLVDPIYDGNGLAPSQTAVIVNSGADTGVWRVIYDAIWNKGTIDGTIGEAALYLRLPTETAFKWSSSTSPAVAMASRLSVADSDFDPYEIDTNNPLVIDWIVTLAFQSS